MSQAFVIRRGGCPCDGNERRKIQRRVAAQTTPGATDVQLASIFQATPRTPKPKRLPSSPFPELPSSPILCFLVALRIWPAASSILLQHHQPSSRGIHCLCIYTARYRSFYCPLRSLAQALVLVRDEPVQSSPPVHPVHSVTSVPVAARLAHQSWSCPPVGCQGKNNRSSTAAVFGAWAGPTSFDCTAPLLSRITTTSTAPCCTWTPALPSSSILHLCPSRRPLTSSFLRCFDLLTCSREPPHSQPGCQFTSAFFRAALNSPGTNNALPATPCQPPSTHACCSSLLTIFATSETTETLLNYPDALAILRPSPLDTSGELVRHSPGILKLLRQLC